MVSYNREQATGDENHNLITVVMLERSLDLSSAMSWAACYHSEVQKKFIDTLAKVPSWGPSIDVLVKEYLHGTANWIRGLDCWSYESPRSQDFSISINCRLSRLELQILWQQGPRDTTNQAYTIIAKGQPRSRVLGDEGQHC
jgi:hypothetical protein